MILACAASVFSAEGLVSHAGFWIYKSYFAYAADFFKSFRRCRGTFFAGTQVWGRSLSLCFLNHFRLRGGRVCFLLARWFF
jgi:hypothetical protein